MNFGISITNKFSSTIHYTTLENVQSAKYLGITITDNMNWGQHVSEISSKATKTLDFLRRNLAFAPRSTKEVAYKTLVWPKLEYAATIWSPHTKLQINQIEKVQMTPAVDWLQSSKHFFLSVFSYTCSYSLILMALF